MEGSREFLQALGFISIMLPVDGQGKIIQTIILPSSYFFLNLRLLLVYLLLTCVCLSWMSEEEEEFLVLPEANPDALELMKEQRDRLQRGEPVRAKLDRQPRAFRPSPHAQQFELPPEFYNLTAEELRKEQQQRCMTSQNHCSLNWLLA